MGKITGFMEYKKQSIQYRDPSEYIKDFDEYLLPFFEDERKAQGTCCMDCGIPFCHSSYGCPVDNLIPEWNHLIYTKR